MTVDEKKLLNIIREEVGIVLNALTRLGIRVSEPAATRGLPEALDSAVRASNTWNKLIKKGTMGAEALESIAIDLKSARTRLDFSASVGMWL